MNKNILTAALLTVALSPSVALAGMGQDYRYDYGYTTYSLPVVVDPYTGPYDGGLEWTMDGNNNLMNRLLGRVWYQIQAPWPYEMEPLAYYAPQPVQTQPWYGGWSWNSWYGWGW